MSVKRRRLDRDSETVDKVDNSSSAFSKQNQKLRHDYRELITDTNKHRHEYVQPGNAGLHQTLDKVEELFKEVKVGQCREAVLDATAIKITAALGAEQAKILNTNLISFESLTFADYLIGFMKPNRVIAGDGEDEEEEFAPSGRRRPRIRQDLDWNKLGQHCHKFFRRRAPTFDLMYGPMALEVKERKAPQKRQTPSVTEKVVPQKLDSTEVHEEATTKEVDRVGKLLVEQLKNAAEEEGQTVEETSISFFDFVLHPTSFSQTIENIFHVSFLVKDGKVGIQMEDDLPFIHLMHPANGTEEQPREQMIVSLDMKEWGQLVNALGLEGSEPTIPPRPS